MSFRDALKPIVIFRLRPTQDLRNPRDAFRYQRRLEQRKAPAKEMTGLGTGPLEPEIVPEAERDLYEDDHLSELRDDWRAEEQELQNWWAQQNEDDEFINSYSE